MVFGSSDEAIEKLDESKIHELFTANESKLSSFGVTEQDVLHRLQQGKKVVLNENCTIDPFDSTLFAGQEPAKRFAILGDTSDARAMLPLLRQTDLLVHESTVIPLQKELRRKASRRLETRRPLDGGIREDGSRERALHGENGGAVREGVRSQAAGADAHLQPLSGELEALRQSGDARAARAGSGKRCCLPE